MNRLIAVPQTGRQASVTVWVRLDPWAKAHKVRSQAAYWAWLTTKCGEKFEQWETLDKEPPPRDQCRRCRKIKVP